MTPTDTTSSVIHDLAVVGGQAGRPDARHTSMINSAVTQTDELSVDVPALHTASVGSGHSWSTSSGGAADDGAQQEGIR